MNHTFLTNIERKWQGFLYFALFTLGILSLAGCGGAQTAQTPASETPLLLIFTSTRESGTPNPTTSPSATATASRTPTWTPVPTLPPEIRKQNLVELFSTNGDCDFPCWWGIQPGDSANKVTELAPVIGKPLRISGPSYYYTLSLDNLNLPDFGMSFRVDADQLVKNIEVFLNQPSRFRDYHNAFEAQLSLASLLRHYGKPSEILFLVTPRFEPGETPRPYTLFLIYDIQGFGIVYSGLVDSENPLRVCSIKLSSHRLQYISLYLQNPRPRIAEINRFNSTELQPLEQVTSMSSDDFYQTFSAPDNNKCIETNTDPWQ